MTPEEILKFVQENNVEIVDLKFCDLPGLWQHFSIPASGLTDSDDPTRGIWVDGIGFDGSSIRGFQEIHESDMLLMLDAETAIIDPACEVPTMSLICDIYDPLTKQPYSRDPRYIAKKAEKYLKATGIADTSYWGPEMEFFIFDDIRFDQNESCGFYYIDSVEAAWNTGKEEKPNLGYKPRYKEGYFPVPPHDSLQDMRSKMILTMARCGIPV
ncbi:MAG: type I glutamate--ammonia ligase, partial [Dehalococcoidales bacterium]|nr:type I glutamate--ammonia ligase [Dehalococcoidales bacterium]